MLRRARARVPAGPPEQVAHPGRALSLSPPSSPQGMDFTTDKMRSLVRKWQTLIEAYVDVKTTDGFTLRVFCIGFTKKRQGQVKRTCYAQASQVSAWGAGRGKCELWFWGENAGSREKGCGGMWMMILLGRRASMFVESG